MRTARKKVTGVACFYHCCARIAGLKNDYLFTDADKEKGMKIVEDFSRLYFIEPVSMCWMGNHWHIVVYANGNLPDLQETADRYNGYYGKKHPRLDPEVNREKCLKKARQLTDISFFMRQIHQKFTYYINRVHERRGTLWAERFKSTILEGEHALWNCVKYVELNAVRAKLVEDPADYRFCSWGRYCGSGKHPFEDNFVRHMCNVLGELAQNWSSEDVYAEFRGEIARTIAYESESTEDLLEVKEKAKQKESMPLRYLRRTRHWCDGAIIGSRQFVQEIACRFDEHGRVIKKQLSSGSDRKGNRLYCFKRLR